MQILKNSALVLFIDGLTAQVLNIIIYSFFYEWPD